MVGLKQEGIKIKMSILDVVDSKTNIGNTICWSFRNRIPELIKSLESADTTCPKNVDFLLIDANSEEKNIKWLKNFVSDLPRYTTRGVRICETFYRTTLPEAWNLALMLSDTRYCIFASSDVLFLKQGWFEMFVAHFKNGSEYVLMPNHAVFGLNKSLVAKIGWFDEGFKNGPHFDPDYMIRASEIGIRINSINNNGFYKHEDNEEVTNKRLTGYVENRLPMNDLYNEQYFKSKWQSNWPGWENAPDLLNLPHPPTNISKVKRLKQEIDPHPLYTERFKNEYPNIG